MWQYNPKNMDLKIWCRFDNQLWYMIFSCIEEKSVISQRTMVQKGWFFPSCKSCWSNHQLYFDDWFPTLSLLLKLKDIGLGQNAPAFRVNWIASCHLMADKELCVKRWGSCDYQTDNNLRLHIVKWWDKKGLILGSTTRLEPTTT